MLRLTMTAGAFLVAKSAQFDLLFRNAELIDGTGAPRFAADVGVIGDRIAAIFPRADGAALAGERAPGASATLPSARRSIDGSGKILAPGFIDVHTHDDTALIDNPGMNMKVSQGVTTVVCGNCGFSVAPYTRNDATKMLSLIVKNQANTGRDFAQFAAKVEAAKPALNSAFLIGHSTLRLCTMGDDLDRVASVAEIEQMRGLLDTALQQGAIGLSSGLFYPAASHATLEEVAQVAEPLGRWGGIYTAHMRDEADHILPAMDETFEIGKRAGASVVVSHHKCSARKNFGRMRETLPKFDSARRKQDISFDVYPYVAGSTILRKEMIARADKVLIAWSDAVAGVSGRDLKDLAVEWGLSMADAADRLQPAGAIYFMMDEADVRSAMAHPAAMIGSDGIPFDTHPHPRLWGTFPRVLGHYSRELKLFPLEAAVHKMTGLSAHNFRLAQRGVVREGYFADLCLFDANTVRDTATFDKPISLSQGIDAVIVNGEVVWSGGRETGKRSGRVLRRQSGAM
jgi:N-acyl-D-amino-acid deacylase